jgi:hypothetical protein
MFETVFEAQLAVGALRDPARETTVPKNGWVVLVTRSGDVQSGVPTFRTDAGPCCKGCFRCYEPALSGAVYIALFWL